MFIPFLCLFYIEYWLCATVGVDAPKSDLNFCKDLSFIIAKPSSFPEYFAEFAKEGRTKLMDHLWYLSEKLVRSVSLVTK